MLPTPLELIKQRFPKAYSKWSEDDDRLLEQKYKAAVSTKELAVIFQRQSGAIRSRLRKLKLSTETSLFHAGSVDVQFVFDWETVLSSENAEYIFPSPITDFMKQRYKKPAIYRWIVAHADNEANTQMYIGETKRLCPDRLSGYIIPGPTQQTNLRLNKFFHECLMQDSTVQLEILRINGSFTPDLSFTDTDLSSQDIRRLLEKLLMVLYRNQGVELINL